MAQFGPTQAQIDALEQEILNAPDQATIDAILSEIGADPAAVSGQVDAAAAIYQANTTLSAQRGVFGAPTMIVSPRIPTE